MSCPKPCCPRPERRINRCSYIAVIFLVLLLALAIGLIIGAMNAETILPAMAALIAFSAAIAAILVALLLLWWKKCD